MCTGRHNYYVLALVWSFIDSAWSVFSPILGCCSASNSTVRTQSQLRRRGRTQHTENPTFRVGTTNIIQYYWHLVVFGNQHLSLEHAVNTSVYFCEGSQPPASLSAEVAADWTCRSPLKTFRLLPSSSGLKQPLEWEVKCLPQVQPPAASALRELRGKYVLPNVKHRNSSS